MPLKEEPGDWGRGLEIHNRVQSQKLPPEGDRLTLLGKQIDILIDSAEEHEDFWRGYRTGLLTVKNLLIPSIPESTHEEPKHNDPC